ncbi:MAG: hypothetical protein IJO43_03745 [Bacilli bacterium]|nr:hypothetical protein [Bacilli bacterium]
MKRIRFFVFGVIALFLFVPKVDAGLVSELFDISFYYFHYLDENGRETYDSFYNWGSEDEEKNGIKIDKTSIDTIKVTIDADSNDMYQKCKPVLMWVHKADGLLDSTKYTDIKQWYINKLEETFLIVAIDDYTEDAVIEVNVPTKLNLGLTGLLNGGYYEIEFYSEDAIPEQLKYAYKPQSYTLDELEDYIKVDMSDNIEDYYDADSGFRSNVDGFTFKNSDYVEKGGHCAGIAAVTTAKYNGYNLKKEYSNGDTKYNIDNSYTWYDSVYGSASIRDLKLNDKEFLTKNSPSLNKIDDKTATAYPLVLFKSYNTNDKAFYDLLGYYLRENNKAALLRGNSYIKGVSLQNLENRWSIIDYVASYLRQGKAVTVNISKSGGGHAIVGYKMEKIDDDTYRLYCYDNNYPDDMKLRYIKGKPQNGEQNKDGSYKNIFWEKDDIYIDFTKKTIVGSTGYVGQREYDVFEFDSSHTSIDANSSNGQITFTLNKGDSVGVFNYGSESNEVIAYRAYPVIVNENTVKIRTFAFYKSGEVEEVTQSINTNIMMDYTYLGWYKIGDSKIIITKDGYKFDNNGTDYVECYVAYDNHTNSFGKIKVRIPIIK